MKRRLIQFVTTYFLFVLIFVLQKPIFMGYYHTLYNKVSWTDYFSVMGHGLPLDFSLAGYLTAIPGLLLIASVWIQPAVIRQIRRGYFMIIAILLSCIFIGDLGLYEYWGFRLDATPLFYLFSSPKDALASVSIWVVMAGLAAMAVYAALLYLIFYRILIYQKQPVKIPFHRLSVSGVLLLATALLFIPIRGGFTVSTMNLSKAYFSSNQRLNHAAINPCFSLIASLSKQQDFAAQFNFFPEEERKEVMETLSSSPRTGYGNEEDSMKPQTLLNTSRPNILIILMESFSANAVGAVGGDSVITPNLNRLSREGVLFTNMYANSFRTDRGIVSVLNGYLAQPTTSIMKYPAKSQTLPSIAKSLTNEGYIANMLYGGDINFTNMQSYFFGSGYSRITADRDFPITSRLSKWGANDDITFRDLYEDIKSRDNQAPWLTTFLTLSSHEPFEVPYHRLDEMGLYPRLLSRTVVSATS